MAPTLARANSLFAAGKFADAADTYRALLATSPQLSTELEALFNLGLVLKGMGQHSEAITNFQRLIERTDQLQAGSAPFRDTSRAQTARWETATSHMAIGEYRNALKAFAEHGRHRIPSFCGNAGAQEHYRRRTHEGACYDSLGDTKQALRAYVEAAFGAQLLVHSEPPVHLRILDIYETAGELPRLFSLLDELDDKEFNGLNKFSKRLSGGTLPPGRFQEIRTSGLIRRVVEMRVSAAQGQRLRLIEILKTNTNSMIPDKRRDWEAIEAIRLLRLTPSKSAHELIAAAQPLPDVAETMLPYAIARCETPEAINWLKAKTLAERDWIAAGSFIRALNSAGNHGRIALNELRLAATTNAVLRVAIHPINTITYAQIPTVAPVFPSRPHLAPLPAALMDLGL